MIKRPRLADSHDSFKENCDFVLVKFRDQKTHEDDPMMKYFISLGRIRNLFWIPLNLKWKLELDSEGYKERPNILMWKIEQNLFCHFLIKIKNI